MRVHTNQEASRNPGRRLLGLLATVLLGVSGLPAQAVAAGRDLRFECRTLSSTVPITRERAQEELPPGFELAPGPSAEQNEVVWLWITSSVCGKDPSAPTLSMARAWLAVKADGYGDARFILAATADGPQARRFQKRLRLEDLFIEGEIAMTEESVSDEVVTGSTAHTSGVTVVSDVLSTTLRQSTAGMPLPQGSSVRWLFETSHGVEFFDSYSFGPPLRMGAGVVRFDQPFLSLPLIGSGPSLAGEGVMGFPNRGCDGGGT